MKSTYTRKSILFLLTLLCIGSNLQAQLVAWQFGSPASLGSEATYAATTNNTNLGTSSLNRGAGVNAIALGRAFSSTNFTASGTKADAITNNKYIGFSITTNAGFATSLSTLDARLRRTSTGPNAYIWRYSTDGTNFFDIGSDISFTSTVDGVDQTQISLTSINALQNVASGTTIYLRVYAWGATATGGTFAIGRYGATITTNSLTIGGTVSTPCTLPGVPNCNIPSPVCTGTAVTINGSGSSPAATTYTYWTAAIGGSQITTGVVGNNLTTSTALPGGTYPFYVQGENGTSCVSATRQQVNVQIYAAPTATVSGGGNVCAGNPMPTVNIGLTGTAPWNVTYSDGTILHIITNILTSPYQITNAAAGTYTVSSVSDYNCSNGTSSGLATVNLNSIPTAFVSGGGTVCAGSTLPNVSITLTGIAPWALTYSNGITTTTVPNILTSPYVITNASAGTYTVTSLTDNNCSGTATGSASVVVNPKPTASLSGGGAVCAGSPLPNVSIALTGTAPWSLTFSDGSTTLPIVTSSNSYTVPNVPVGNYSVTSISDNFCAGNASASISVTITPLPSVNVISSSVCTSATINALPNTGGTWVSNNASASIDNAGIITGLSAGIATFTFTDATTTCSNTTNSITVNASPTVTASLSSSTICYLTSVTAVGGGASSYTWSGGISDNTPFIGASSVTYIVTGTDANSCTGTSAATLTVNAMSTQLAAASIGNANSSTSATNAMGTTFQTDLTTASYTDVSCNLIALIQDVTSGTALGNTTAAVTIEGTIQTYNGQPYCRRWYNITPSNQGAANVTLYVTQGDFDDYNAANGVFPDLPTSGNNSDPNIPNIAITKVSGGGLGTGTPTVIIPTVNWNATTNYWELSFPVTSFSQFYFHSINPGNVPLPATLSSFTGRKLETSDLLEWTTSSEQNNASFNLQHSTDGTSFATIGNIRSNAANGNSTAALNYDFTNVKPALGHNYYRLQQVDLDNKLSIYSKVLDLIWGANGSSVNIYPNPTNGVLNVDLYTTKAANTTVKIMDMSGKIVKQIQTKSNIGMNHISIDMDEVSQGIYTLQVFENDKLSFTEKVKKNN